VCTCISSCPVRPRCVLQGARCAARRVRHHKPPWCRGMAAGVRRAAGARAACRSWSQCGALKTKTSASLLKGARATKLSAVSLLSFVRGRSGACARAPAGCSAARIPPARPRQPRRPPRRHRRAHSLAALRSQHSPGRRRQRPGPRTAPRVPGPREPQRRSRPRAAPGARAAGRALKLRVSPRQRLWPCSRHCGQARYDCHSTPLPRSPKSCLTSKPSTGLCTSRRCGPGGNASLPNSRCRRQGAHVLRDRPLRAVLGEQLYRALLPLAEHRGLLPGAGLSRARQPRLSLAARLGTLRCERRAASTAAYPGVLTCATARAANQRPAVSQSIGHTVMQWSRIIPPAVSMGLHCQTYTQLDCTPPPLRRAAAALERKCDGSDRSSDPPGRSSTPCACKQAR